MRHRRQSRAPRTKRHVITAAEQAEIIRLGEKLLAFGPLELKSRLPPLPARLDAKAALVRAVASAWFQEEALSFEQIREHLKIDERRFLVSVMNDRPASAAWGPFDAITGVFPLADGEVKAFISQKDRDWDDLHVANSFAPKDAPCNPCIGVNIVVSIPYIFGKNAFSMDLAMVALMQHICLMAGPVNLFGSHPDGPTPYFLTTVTAKEETYYWAQELGMEFVATTDHDWTKAVVMQRPNGELSFAERWAQRVCQSIKTADEVTFY